LAQTTFAVPFWNTLSNGSFSTKLVMIKLQAMQVHCPSCNSKLFVDDAQFSSQRLGPIKCWMCASTVLVRKSSRNDSGAPTVVAISSAPDERARASRLDDSLAPETQSLTLPQDHTIKICVITGTSRGMECELSRPLMTIGRLGGGADIEIDDPEVSRLHCAVEVKRDAILLRDLSSTNGTYLGESRVFAGRLEPMSQFRIGTTLLQVCVVPVREKSRI
jgi:uncharacterized protein YlaI